MCVCVSRFYDLKRKAKTIIYKPKAKLTETNNTKWRWAQAQNKGKIEPTIRHIGERNANPNPNTKQLR